ncbi:MAG TPA: hypothetical protein VLK25_12125 [Allosphingosinicella sp.]|nr:hypothetical protein [Allosphingosinicella sp.]
MNRPFDMTQEDWARFRGLIKDIDMSDQQKDEVILIVLNLMQVFVDQSFGLDPVQLATSPQEKLGSSFSVCSANVSPEKEGRILEGKPVPKASDFGGLSP